MGLSWCTCCALAVIALSAAVYHCEGYPTKENVKLLSRSTDGGLDIEFDSASVPDDNMGETMSKVFAKLDTLDVKAVYQREINLEKLVGGNNEKETSQEPTDSSLPKYVVTREEKIYFFTDPTKQTSGLLAKDQGIPEKAEDEDDILQKYMQVAKKHVNNPPPWAKRNPKALTQQPSLPTEIVGSSSGDVTKQYKDTEKLDQLIEKLKRYMNGSQ